MAETRISDGERPRRRRWSFADCVFDEANWTLTVDGRRVSIENKPLELLRELLLNAGNLVSKDDLFDAIWPDVMVVEASLPTAVRKLRTALNDDARPTQIIETVPRIGYRLAVPVAIEDQAGAVNGQAAAANDDHEAGPGTRRRRFGARRLLAAGVLVLGLGALAMPLTSSQEVPATKAAATFSQRDVTNALRRLDVPAVERMIDAGWNPDAPIGTEGNSALHQVLEMCEWDRGHDRNRLLLMARTLYEGGAKLDHPNVYGDTPYSIAKAPRFCGPEHPVTRSIRDTCYSGSAPLGDRCLASYELARRRGG